MERPSARVLLPANAFDGVHFAPEAVEAWTQSSDVFRFLCDGTLLKSAEDHYALSLFNGGRATILKIAMEFREHAQGGKGSIGPVIEEVPHFERDSAFGLMAKYKVAYEGLENAMLSDGAFVSLPHMLEIGADLDCSLLLASRLYYKQAFQSLRGVIEHSVAQVHFIAHPDDFHGWVAGEWHLPRMRGKNGWLALLKRDDWLSGDLDITASELYGALNGAVHSSERFLNYSDVVRGNVEGIQFKRPMFDEWTALFSQTVDLSIRFLAQMLDHNQRLPTPNSPMCDVCRRSNTFDVTSRDESHVSVKCRVCGSECGYSVEYAAKYGL
jgi:hypothetical protein